MEKQTNKQTPILEELLLNDLLDMGVIDQETHKEALIKIKNIHFEDDHDIKDIKVLKKSDLTFDEKQDRMFTYLILEDYDWMYYRLQARFMIRKVPCNVEFSYFGAQKSQMLIEYGSIRIKLTFPTHIFDKYIEKYLLEEISCIKSNDVFNGEDIILDFWNEVMDKYCSITGYNGPSIKFPK